MARGGDSPQHNFQSHHSSSAKYLQPMVSLSRSFLIKVRIWYPARLKACSLLIAPATGKSHLNDTVERSNWTIEKDFSTAHIDWKDWRQELDPFLLSYRATPHAMTAVSLPRLCLGVTFAQSYPNYIHQSSPRY